MKPPTLYIIGPTNSGKSTFLKAILAEHGPRIGLIEVGKVLRAKYPSEYFKGLNNPAHTAVEAWKIFTDSWDAYAAFGKEVIITDGQPRDTKQTLAVIERGVSGERQAFIHLWAPLEIRRARAELRDLGNEAALELSRQRLVNDEPANYNVLCMLLAANRCVVTPDTSAPGYTALGTYQEALEGAR